MTADGAAIASVPGTLASVDGQGVLLTGDSGTGKSEIVLGLLDRGHCLIADDVVNVQVRRGRLIGSSPPALAGLIAIRDIGIIDASAHFGSHRLIEAAPITLIVHLCRRTSPTPLAKDWDSRTILAVTVPQLTLTVAPGRNLPLLVETAVREHAQRHAGLHVQRRFIAWQARIAREGA